MDSLWSHCVRSPVLRSFCYKKIDNVVASRWSRGDGRPNASEAAVGIMVVTRKYNAAYLLENSYLRVMKRKSTDAYVTSKTTRGQKWVIKLSNVTIKFPFFCLQL